MKSIMYVAVLFACLVPACGGRTGDEDLNQPGVTTSVGGSSATNSTGGSMNVEATGGASTRPENSTVVEKPKPTSTGGASSASTTSTSVSSTGGNVATTSATTVAEICNDGSDNDRDGLIDCRDSDCANDPSCVSASTGGTTSVSTTSTIASATGGSTVTTATGGTNSTGGSSANIAGSTSVSTGGAAGAITTDCEPEIHVTILGHNTATVLPGTAGLATLETQQVVTCKNIDVKSSDYQIVARGRDATDATPYGNNFTNIKLHDPQTSADIGGPLASPKEYSVNDHGHLTFTESYTLEKDKPRAVTVTLDIPATFNSGQLDTSYQVYFLGLNTGNGDIPIVVSYVDNFDSLNWPAFTVSMPLVVSLSSTTPSSQIIVSGPNWGSWYVFSDYVVKNRSTVPQTIASTTVSGSIANFIDINVSVCANNYPAGAGLTNYAPGSWITLADGSLDVWHPNTSAHFADDSSLLFDLTVGSARTILNQNEEVHLCVIGTPSAVRSEAQDAATPGRDPRSGDLVYLKISDLTNTNGAHAFIEDPNSFSDCSSAGCVMAHMATFKPSLMTLRKTKPVVSILPLPTTTLTNGLNTVFKFNISTNSNGGPIKFAQFSVKYEKIGSLTISNLRVFKNNVELTTEQEARITSYTESNEKGEFTVTLNKETIIDSNGAIYALVGDVTSTQNGDTLLTQFRRSRFMISQTGSICHPSGSNNFIITDDVAACTANSPEFMSQGSFLWSDMSDPVDVKDWTDDFLVQSLDGSSVLSC